MVLLIKIPTNIMTSSFDPEFYLEIKKQVTGQFQEYLSNNDIDSAIKSYYSFYHEVVKLFESKEHYEKSFNLINEPFEKVIDSVIDKIKIDDFNSSKTDKKNKNICIYLNNIENNLAHIDFLESILSYHSNNFTIYLLTKEITKTTVSKKIQGLLDKKIIKEIIFIKKLNYECFMNFFKDFNNFFNKFIVFALPDILPFFCKILKNKVIYISLKFELGCFSNLSKGITFNSDKFKKKKINTTDWYILPRRSIDLNYNEYNKKYDDNEIKIISVNREEKILNTKFLLTITKILKLSSKTKFYWAANNANEIIINFFKSQNLYHRTRFIGFVNPSEIINDYDIFIDAPYLSGIISQNFFTSGMPTLTFKNSTSIINIFSKDIFKLTKQKFSFNDTELIDHCLKLINDQMYRKKTIANQKKTKRLFNKNHGIMYEKMSKVFLDDKF